MKNKTEFIEPRCEHKSSLFWWNVIAHESATWSKWDGLGFADYYFVQHKLFKNKKTLKYFGYKPKEHPEWKEFFNKYYYQI